MKIIPLSEGSFTIDKTKQFVPINLVEESLQNRPLGSLLVEIQPFVVITKKDTILIDTGLGFLNENGEMRLIENLKNHGIDPHSVTKVLLSHLHKDHAGGVSYPDQSGSSRFLSFPYANWYLQKREFEEAMENETASYHKEDFEMLSSFSKVIWLNEDEGTIDSSIHFQVTGAHSKFHQVFWIEEENQIAFFGGDVAPQLQQMKSRIVAKYDYDGKKAMELRQQWWNEGQERKWNFLFYHDIKNPIWSN